MADLLYEFHVSRKARDVYRFDANLFSSDGRVIVADFSAARRFAAQMSEVRGSPVPASDINAMGLIDEIMHIVIRQYELQNPDVLTRAVTRMENSLGKVGFEQAQLKFLEEFPPVMVYQKQVWAADFLNAYSGGRSNRKTTLEEMLILHVTNLNPAVQPYKELFDDTALKPTGYENVVKGLSDFFSGEQGFEGANSTETLIRVLRAPAIASPYSLEGQLQFLLKQWGVMLGEAFVERLLRGMDYVKEDATRGQFAGGFAGEISVMTFGNQEYTEYERFSPDKDWMPRLVLIAKNSYVWLDQLSKKYERDIRTLDAIPDDELDRLAGAGITGLWLIGLWERSIASKTIKQMMGNPEAVASAYSLMDYQIAEDLGGWAALESLRWRAWQRGIRLSADMVPNHMGIDSTWVVQHPDWFLSLPYPPYPGYSFNGKDLSNDSRVGIFIEDHYYDKTDAAVVFKRADRWTGDVRYIYHGNDGTSMAWNDTAQLDYLKAEVREAVIQTILHVARSFPIIRFDAAMTLAKRHIQRLWFPEPGSGGAIPSRSEHGLTREQFDQAIPEEFWREVVDRIAAEVPDTLLLAEAFWMMEGYFVRTLGMHRVYNSAFMHMMRNEDNAKYRAVMKNTLEFDPQVLKRFVNFMNNPDEKTAIEQFGNGEKYFGVATLMTTLPGLPMIGHGQIEGFREKYGMEYRRAYWDEQPDTGLIDHHERVIYPLMRRRYLFAEMDLFLLYDVFSPEGAVNEDIYAYSNGSGNERALIIYHNKFAETRGWIKTSTAYMDKGSGEMLQKTLGEGLGLRGGENDYLIFRDVNSGLEFIRPSRSLAENGLYVELGAYKCHAFVDFREVYDEDGKWKTVSEALNGAGYWAIQARWDELFAPKVTAEVVEEVITKKPKKVRKPATKKPVTEKKTAKISTSPDATSTVRTKLKKAEKK
ncbi:MAG: alpha-amylase family glycosyl hydrolase [Chloroflexi bacterium]|nr:alpha-amylase family glycosyl hydrolase [Chloroflexota bacterium]